MSANTSQTHKSNSLNTKQSSELRLDGVFRKSTFSDNGGCVSIARFEDGSVKVRDTKDATQTTLSYTKKEWRAFLLGVRAGEFDIE